MKRVINAGTTVKMYRNNRNPHKLLEVHDDGHGHKSVKQVMRFDETGVTNPTGDGRLHRISKPSLEELLADYSEVTDSLPRYEGKMLAKAVEKAANDFLEASVTDKRRAHAQFVDRSNKGLGIIELYLPDDMSYKFYEQIADIIEEKFNPSSVNDNIYDVLIFSWPIDLFEEWV